MKRMLLARLEAGSTKMGTCWLWNGYLRNGFHGAISVHDRPVYIHQLSYAIHYGPIPAGLCVCHACDIPRCWWPGHLFLGTQMDNMADAIAKGRAARPPIIRGSHHHMATLTDDQVAAIRRSWAEHPVDQRALAAEYGVAQSTIWRVIHGVTRVTAA